MRDGSNMARALGRSTSASALLEGTLQKPLILGKRDNSHGDAPTLLAFARRHPDQFQRGSWKGDYRLISIGVETWLATHA